MQHKQNKIMSLKEFLISIGRLPKDGDSLKEDHQQTDDAINISEGQEKSGSDVKMQMIGDVFDIYKKLGYDKLPDYVQINAPGWQGNPSPCEVPDHNRDKQSY
jgi:hypothetical protein